MYKEIASDDGYVDGWLAGIDDKPFEHAIRKKYLNPVIQQAYEQGCKLGYRNAQSHRLSQSRQNDLLQSRDHLKNQECRER